MFRFRLLLAACAIAFFVFPMAILTEQTFAQTPNAPVANGVTGLWKGSRSFMTFSTEVAFDLQQSGDKISGTARWGLSSSGLGGTGGPLEGIRSGNKITFQIPSQSFTGEVELSGDELRGSLVGPYEYELVLRREK
jgi:hypothetical protein